MKRPAPVWLFALFLGLTTCGPALDGEKRLTDLDDDERETLCKRHGKRVTCDTGDGVIAIGGDDGVCTDQLERLDRTCGVTVEGFIDCIEEVEECELPRDRLCIAYRNCISTRF